MALTQTLRTVSPVWDAFDREAVDMTWAVDRARRNPWFGGDVLAPEFGPVLSSIVAPKPMRYSDEFTPGPEWRGHRNGWRLVLGRGARQ